MRAEVARTQAAQSLNGLDAALKRTGELGAGTARFIREHAIRIGFRAQSAGARWTIDRRIELNPQFARDLTLSAYGLSLVVHEVRHLQQGWVTALSVYGELDAWQTQFGFLSSLSATVPGTEVHRAAVRELLSLPLDWDRTILSNARRLMQEYGGRRYRVDLLPLYPFPHELAYLIARRTPGGS